jgi:CheY-like chemotaxis protein
VTTVFGLGLQDEGFDIYTYNDPLEALSQFRPNFYDLLLIDINMPKMNGTIPLDDIADAYEKVANGKVRFRAVIKA